MNRISLLRSKILEKTVFSQAFYYYFHKKYAELAQLPPYKRYAEAASFAFEQMPPSIAEGELIVGKRDIPMTAEQEQEWRETYHEIAKAEMRKAGSGQDSHMAIDYNLLLSQGVLGVQAQVRHYLAANQGDAEKKAFYEACLVCLEAVITHAENYAAAALEQAKTADPVRRAELEKIAAVCHKVPAHPAESFYEAVQSVYFMTYCLSLNPLRGVEAMQQFQLGHPDRYLLPYYERDIASGALTKAQAQELLDCLGVQMNALVPRGLSSGYMVGGRDENGRIVANDLTMMGLQVIEDVHLVYPAVGFCLTEGMPEEYLDKACQLLAKGYSHPAIFNDDLITESLMHYGVPAAQAHHYIHSTCVEITPVAASNVWVASPYTNLPQLLLDVMDREYPSLDALLSVYFEKLDASIQANFESMCRHRQDRAEHSMFPLLSCFVHDCLSRGVDIEKGGAIYNWVMPSFVGMSNLIDSLYAIKTVVFDEKKVTMCELKAMLDRNFEGDEPFRLYLLNRIPKYGNDVDSVDQYYSLITTHIVEECKKHHGVHSNASLIPSVFCWVMHEEFGRKTGATPDGRTAGFPLGDGSGPCQGREHNGPTASVLSSTKWDHAPFIGGVAVNLKFSRSSFGPNAVETMKTLIKTYKKLGGFEVQINVVDNEMLRKAQKDPDSYQDLIVRIGGYSDYFTHLSPQMQEEVIRRTSHQL